ncbi:MAG: glycerol-3-phosphate dehydrogenase/oxidase [Myxococcales bacterium]|nr:glycerol-3-phosphate dehydrogenase/oxidase [Myxococcales bacterium]
MGQPTRTGPDPPRGSLDARRREDALRALEDEVFDCVVIGGGMTGAGIAWQGALRGLRVALLEAADFAEGTSSRSTKLIHGGLRYLAQGDVRLVRDTARERKVVHRLARHLAQPRWLIVPAPNRRTLWKLRLGVGLYERLGGVPPRHRHQCWNRRDLEREEPALSPAPRFACVYREYATHDARLVVSVLRAAVDAGAVVANRLRATELLLSGERAAGIFARCAETDAEIRVRGRVVINAAGPWVDAVRRFEQPGSRPRLHLSKGVHLGIRRERLPLRNMALLDAPDGRRVFAVPSGDVTYVGTTDTTHPGDAELWPSIAQRDVDYLIETLRNQIPDANVTEHDVLSTWSGLRPLIAQPGKGPSEISRRDETWVGARSVVHIAGGKLTGFRPMAIRALQLACKQLERPLSEIEEEALPGGDFRGSVDALAGRLRHGNALPGPEARRLAGLYGTEAASIRAFGSERVTPETWLLRGEVAWSVCVEGARTSADVLYRRTGAALLEPEARRHAVRPVAKQVGALLGWSESRIEEDAAATEARLAADLRFEPA